MTETTCPIYCHDCAREIKSSVVILKKQDYMRLKQFGTSGCACETDAGKIVELCCAHNEYYQDKLTKLREAFKEAVNIFNTQGDLMYYVSKKLLMVVKELLEENK